MEYYAKAQFDKLSPSCTQQASKQLPSHLACPNEYCPLRCTLQSEITFLAPKKFPAPNQPTIKSTPSNYHTILKKHYWMDGGASGIMNIAVVVVAQTIAEERT